MLRSGFLCTVLIASCFASDVELLPLDIISYETFMEGGPEVTATIERALHENGIVGIRGVPGYKEKVLRFIESAREFSALPEEVKELCAPDHARGDMFLGYEKGKERFKRPDGKWVLDDLKVSYYAHVPDSALNKWPTEVALREPYEEIGVLMSETGAALMKLIGLVGQEGGVSIDGIPRVGRMLYYRKSIEGSSDNPFWCGAHYDHGLFTVLLPAFYFVSGERIDEPDEAGLFVKTPSDGIFKKVKSDDPEVMLFQVGEFAQLMTNDAIKATEHRVHKALGSVERYTLALFYDVPMDTTIHSFSELTQDARYGGGPGDPCVFRRWCEESFKRYILQID